MKKNKLIIAAAGSGKTTYIVKEALKNKESNTLITTYTLANEEEIRRKFIKINNCIPKNITIQTWFSFLIQHGANPYRGNIYKKDIKGLVLVSRQSATGISESNTEKHYFSSDQKIYSDKLSKFVVKCNKESSGFVVDRISKIYDYIFIDEVQDLAGHDLEVLKLFFSCKSKVFLVGDPRQGIYSTNHSSKHKSFTRSKIINFFEDKTICESVDIDYSLLNINYRCMPIICDFSNKLYPEFNGTISGNLEKTGHDGIYLVDKKDVDFYLQTYQPVQLRNNKKVVVSINYKVLNFGKSKGLEFPRVLIYPTKNFIEWIKDHSSNLPPISRSNFYVALTRAMFSVGIVCDHNIFNNIKSEELKKFNDCTGSNIHGTQESFNF